MTFPSLYKAWYLNQTGVEFPEYVDGLAAWLGAASGTRIVPGVKGTGRRFLGAAQRIHFISEGTTLFNWALSDFAILARLSRNTLPTVDEQICSKRDAGVFAWQFDVGSTGKLRFYMYERGTVTIHSLDSKVSICDGLVHDVAVWKSGSQLHLIVDGVITDSATLTIAGTNDGGSFVIGNLYDGNYWFDGNLESLEFWSDVAAGSIPAIADFSDAIYFQSTMAVRPVSPFRGEAQISGTATIDYWVDDVVNAVTQASLNVWVDGDPAIVAGVAQTDYTVTLTSVGGSGLHIEIEPDPVTKLMAWGTAITVRTVVANDAVEAIDESYDFYIGVDNDPPFFQSQAPADHLERASTTTAIYFEIADTVAGVDISTLVLRIDTSGIQDFQLVHSGGIFQGPYSGSVTEDPTEGIKQYNVTIDAPGLPIDKPIYLWAQVEDFAGNVADIRYWFRTVELGTLIEPVFPVDQESLVSTGESLAIGFEFEDPLTVTVGGVLAYDDGLVPKFRNSWGGSFLDDDKGKRLILEPPAPFTIDTNVTVVSTTTSSSKTYVFRVSSQQITTTGDVTTPKITEATAANIWIGYIRGGSLVLRKGDPLEAETTVIPARQWDHGYDPTLGKYVLYWIDNGHVFYSTADPGDSPEILPQPSIVNATVTESMAGSERIEARARLTRSPPEPLIKGVPPDGVQEIDIFRPTSDPAAGQLVGYKLMTYVEGTTNLIKYIEVEPVDPTSYVIPDYLPDMLYFVIPVYERGGQLLDGAPSVRTRPPDYSTLISEGMAGGERAVYVLTSTSFPPLKFFSPDDVVEGMAGSERVAVLEIVSYENLKVLGATPDGAVEGMAGSERIGNLTIGGFGIIGVG